jgi:hypothetical protein
MVLQRSKNLRYLYHSTHYPVKTQSETLPTEALKVPPIPRTSHVSGFKETTQCQDHFSS